MCRGAESSPWMTGGNPPRGCIARAWAGRERANASSFHCRKGNHFHGNRKVNLTLSAKGCVEELLSRQGVLVSLQIVAIRCTADVSLHWVRVICKQSNRVRALSREPVSALFAPGFRGQGGSGVISRPAFFRKNEAEKGPSNRAVLRPLSAHPAGVRQKGTWSCTRFLKSVLSGTPKISPVPRFFHPLFFQLVVQKI